MNERQRAILSIEGLPTNENQLTFLQKKKITRINELLDYVEKKYNQTFEYKGYIFGNKWEREELILCTKAGCERYDSFSVYRERRKDNKEVIKDDYIKVGARGIYESFIYKFVQQFFSNKSFLLYSKITDYKGDNLLLTTENIIGSVGGNIIIAIDSGYVKEEQFNDFWSLFERWATDCGLYGIHRALYIKKGELNIPSQNEYMEEIPRDYVIYIKECSIQGLYD